MTDLQDLTEAQRQLLEELCMRGGRPPAISRDTGRKIRGRQAATAAVLVRKRLVAIELVAGTQLMWLTSSGRILIDDLQMCG